MEEWRTSRAMRYFFPKKALKIMRKKPNARKSRKRRRVALEFGDGDNHPQLICDFPAQPFGSGK